MRSSMVDKIVDYLSRKNGEWVSGRELTRALASIVPPETAERRAQYYGWEDQDAESRYRRAAARCLFRQLDGLRRRKNKRIEFRPVGRGYEYRVR